MKKQFNNMESCIFTIFGATGDLTKRKLIPAVYILYKQHNLPSGFTIIAIGRREKTIQEYRNEMYRFMTENLEKDIKPEDWDNFKDKIIYKKMNFLDDLSYDSLKELSNKVDSENKLNGNRIYYLATAPEYFEVIINKLHLNGMLDNNDSWQRVMIEKPFGSDLRSAKDLNEKITDVLSEDKIFRIDHYLGKEMIQNILSLRFGNSIFEPLWNNKYIDNVQIISTETLGVENRGAYYEKTEIIKDMLQNHILQMLSLIAMEPPVNLEPESIRDEKVKVLKALRPFSKEKFSKEVVKGQYGRGPAGVKAIPGYREEDRVSDQSNIETFIAVKTSIDNFRWGGVPIYIFAGKRMDRKTTKIIVRFKKLPGINFYSDFNQTEPNVLVIRIQPEEGLFFQINAKRPGNDFNIGPVEMNYCQNCKNEYNSPEAYERLILEAINNNAALFTRWDELENSWKYIDSLIKAGESVDLGYPNYKSGSRGPEAAFKLIENDGRKWWKEKGDEHAHI